MRRAVVLLVVAVLAAGCRHRDEGRPVGPPAPRQDPVDPVAPGVTHGAFITDVATTEAGDAALTVDGLGEVRLWPSLDGKRPPVPVGVAGAAELALGRAGKNLLAAIVGEAGDVLLLQLGLDGSVRGRAQVPGDVPCERIIATGSSVLVVRADQSIERYDADARLRGRVVAAPGERIEAIAARRGHAVALISGTVRAGEPEIDGEAAVLRHLVLDKDMRWGTSVALPTPVYADALALSPDQSRVAVMNRRTFELQVIQLSNAAQIGSSVKVHTIDAALGFTDDDHVAALSPDLRWWQAPFQAPGSEPAVPDISEIAGGAISDGIAVGGRGAALVIATPIVTRYLGWSVPAFGTLRTLDREIVMEVWGVSIWLDGRLRSATKREAASVHDPVWIGPHHVVTERSGTLDLVDTDRPEQSVAIGNGSTRHLFYEPTLHLLGVYLSNGTVERYELDLEHTAVTRLAPLGVSPTFSSEGAPRLELLDPTRTDGVIAIARYYGHAVHQADRTHVAIYRDSDVPGATIWPVRESVVAEAPAVDSTGAIYVREKANSPLVMRREGKPDMRFAGVEATELVPSHDGAHVATLHKNEIAVLDVTGTERWRHALWNPKQVVFSSDDRQVIVGTAGGIVAFDAATGTRIAASCAFDFGLHEEPIPVNALQSVPVCEASP